MAKPQKEGFEPLFRQKITMDDEGHSPVKFYDSSKKRMTPEQIAAIEWRDVEMDINLSISSVFVNAGNWGGAIAGPTSILSRSNDTCEFSDGETESFD